MRGIGWNPFPRAIRLEGCSFNIISVAREPIVMTTRGRLKGQRDPRKVIGVMPVSFGEHGVCEHYASLVAILSFNSPRIDDTRLIVEMPPNLDSNSPLLRDIKAFRKSSAVESESISVRRRAISALADCDDG